MNKQELMHAINRTHMATSASKAGLEYIEDIHASRLFPNPKIGLLIGSSRVGKTKICEKFKMERPDIHFETRSTRRVVNITIHGAANSAYILSKIYQALMGKQLKMKGRGKPDIDSIVGLLALNETEIIIIDEIQHTLTKVANPTGRVGEIVNDLKVLLDKSKVPILMCGLPVSKNIYSMINSADETSQQLRFRSNRHHTIQRLSIDEIVSVLGGFEKKLDKLGITNVKLKSNNFAKKFFVASHGRIGVISELIQYAIKQSKQANTLTHADWCAAGNQLLDEDKNPLYWLDTTLDIRIKEIEREYLELRESV